MVFNLDSDRRVFVSRFLRLVLAGVAFTFLGVIWNISFSGLGVYFASFFAVAGVALFAHWSILSNITASVILYFYYPYQIGSRVKIIDGENSVMGVVKDLNLFAIKIETNDGEVSYPNNLAVQKPIIQLLS
ncbi:MAG: mechanosensitive ion channel [Cytophagales bacterium]|nr:mechanosensitive ion channel [Cytophagales bacterium]